MMVTGKYSALWYLIEHYVDHHFTHWFLHYFQGHHDLAEGSLANQCHVDRANDTITGRHWPLYSLRNIKFIMPLPRNPRL